MTQEQLSARSVELASQDPSRYVRVGVTALRSLETGRSQPRLSTAATLAAALGTTATELFPNGFANPVRNPEGRREKVTPAGESETPP